MCERERERERHGHITVESAVLTVACVLQIHTSIITVSVTRLCSPFGLELMVKLRILLTVFIFTLKAEARDYGKGHYISDARLWCSANHNALCQLANLPVTGSACVGIFIYMHTLPVTGRFVKHLQLMSSLHFRLGDAKCVVNDLFMHLHNRF